MYLFIYYNNIIIIYNIIYEIKKQEIKKKTFQKFLIFSRVFLPILLNIGLHFYTIKIQIQY